MTAWSLELPQRHSLTTKPSNSTNLALYKTLCSKLTFSNGPIVHVGQLWLNDNGEGIMRVKFYSADLGRPESIDEFMTVQNSPQGILLVGSNPVYSGTQRRHPSYSPDNFLLRIDENGRYAFFTFDLNGNISAVDVEQC